MYDLEALEYCERSQVPTITAASDSNAIPSQKPQPASASKSSQSDMTHLNPTEKSREDPSAQQTGAPVTPSKVIAAPMDVAKIIKETEALLVRKKDYNWFSYVATQPLLVREHKHKGREAERWIQLHCAVCGATVNSVDEYFTGVHGLVGHVSKSECRKECDAQGLRVWDYIKSHCMQEVSEEHVATIVSGQSIPKFRGNVSDAKRFKNPRARAAKHRRIAHPLQLKVKPLRPRSTSDSDDLYSDAEPSEEEMSDWEDPDDAPLIHKPRHRTPPMATEVESQVCKSIETATTEPLVTTAKTNDIASRKPKFAARNLPTSVAGGPYLARMVDLSR